MESLRKNHNRIISLKQAKKLIILLVLVFLFDFLLFPFPVLANDLPEQTNFNNNQTILVNSEQDNLENNNIILNKNKLTTPNRLPKNKNWSVKWSSNHIITAYNSEPAQCDDTPCITANGFNVCEHNIEDTIAANFLPFGTKVRIPDLYGNKIFIVRDRMNKRYSNRLDIWMLNKTDAIKFGVKLAKIEVLE